MYINCYHTHVLPHSLIYCSVTSAPSSLGEVTVSWTEPASNNAAISSYTIIYTNTGDAADTLSTTIAAADVVTVDANTHIVSTDLSGLSLTDEYTFTVLANNLAGDSDVSSITSSSTCTVMPAIPNAPTSLTTTVLSPTSVRLSWSAPVVIGSTSNELDVVDTYTVQVSDDGGANYMDITTEVSITTITNTHAVAIQLLENTEYSFKVRADNISGK